MALPACASTPPITKSLPLQSLEQFPAVGPQVSQSVSLLRWAIIGQESGANFRAVNRHSGALGYAQVMPSNLPKWSMEALGRVVSRAEFLSNPDVQIAIVDYKLSQYWRASLRVSGGNEAIAVKRVAAWWYSGRPEKYRSTTPEYYNGYRYPSIATYSNSIFQRYRSLSVAVRMGENPGTAVLRSGRKT